MFIFLKKRIQNEMTAFEGFQEKVGRDTTERTVQTCEKKKKDKREKDSVRMAMTPERKKKRTNTNKTKHKKILHMVKRFQSSCCSAFQRLQHVNHFFAQNCQRP